MMGFVLNSRPIEHRERFHEAMGPALGANWTIVDCPVLTAEPLSVQMPPAGGFDLILFTSQIPAALFPIGPVQAEQKMMKFGETSASTFTRQTSEALGSVWADKKVLAVGEATANTARAAGFSYVIDTGKDVDDMRAYLSRTGFGHALYPSAEDVTTDLAKEFPRRITRVVTYRMVPRTGLDLDTLAPGWSNGPVLAPLFSRRSAETLAGLVSKMAPDHADITAVAISADALAPGPWARTIVADEPTLAGVVAACARTAQSMDKST